MISHRINGTVRWASTIAVAAFFGVVGACVVHRYAPPPSAVVRRGSEDVFAVGLHEREIPPRGRPLRWTGRLVELRFRYLSGGAASVDVALHGHRQDVIVSADGVVLGSIPPGVTLRSFPIRDGRTERIDIDLVTETFDAAGGRKLGALLDRVTVTPRASFRPSNRLVLAFLLVACAWSATLLIIDGRLMPALAWAVIVVFLLASALWPYGMLRSHYTWRVASLLLAAAFAGLFILRRECREHGHAAHWALAGILATIYLHGVVATSPTLIPTDAVFHAHKLQEVASGNAFLTSNTQHNPPFRIPYGVTFYLLLTPFLKLGAFDPVDLVRWGAALAQIASGLTLLILLARRDARRAGITLLLLQLVPGSLVYYGYGNFSNIFGQAMTTLFFAWWAMRPFGGWVVGSVLFALGGLAHLSSLFVLGCLTTALIVVDAKRSLLDRTRLTVVGIGCILCAAYYSFFTRLIVDQTYRLLEGGHGRTATGSLTDALRLQAHDAFWQWGPPLLLLGLVYVFLRRADPLARHVLAYCWAGLGLAALAVVTPVEVRYVFALTIPLALMAGFAARALMKRGRWHSFAAWTLIGAQGLLTIFTERGWAAALGFE